MVDDAGQYQARRDIPNHAFWVGCIARQWSHLVGGLYPTDSAEKTLAIIAGTTIVALFAVYIVLKWRSFSA